MANPNGGWLGLGTAAYRGLRRIERLGLVNTRLPGVRTAGTRAPIHVSTRLFLNARSHLVLNVFMPHFKHVYTSFPTPLHLVSNAFMPHFERI